MLNQVCIVGRIANKPVIKEDIITKNKYLDAVICVPRNYKNDNGKYDNDYVETRLWNNLANNSIKFLHQGDMIGIKGSVGMEKLKDKKGKTLKKLMVKAEKVTVLAVAKENQSLDKEDKGKEER